MLTAEHCAPGGGVRFVDPTGEQIGVAEPAPARRLSDSLYIPTRSAARIYDGGVGGRPVAGRPPVAFRSRRRRRPCR
ncbi:hypothetical protein [Micromonospora sp. NPDC051296]|uniref:hypothetical protein n=1 Tax=Micromonospora sp. NPDC051296 TaxID=3155046 RepID=UPI00342813C3